MWCDEKPPPGTKVIPTKWVLVTKGDPPEVRARLVACEVKHEKGSDAALFVATPPIDALRCIISGACHDPETTLDLVDVRKAHLNGLARRVLYVRLPDGRVVRLLRALYGTRDAAVCWEECIRAFMLERNFVQGKTSPCIFVHVERNLRVFVHGDDFVTAGTLPHCRWFRAEMASTWEIKERGALGYELTEVRILGRVLRRTSAGYELEADSRHARMIREALGFSKESKGVNTPGCKPNIEEEKTPLGPEETRAYRSVCMRAAYLAVDRPELLYAVKECARRMSAPDTADLVALKRIGRYLQGSPRLLQHYPWQGAAKVLIVECDSDFAGCHATRKSTSGYIALWGTHCVSARSKTQSVVATSTGEAEFYSMCSAISNGLGLKALMADLHWTVELRVRTDASAGLAMMSRRGLGRTKHLAVQYMWAQSLVASGAIQLVRVAGEENRSDLMTKHLARPRLEKLVVGLGFEFAYGTAQLELKSS